MYTLAGLIGQLLTQLEETHLIGILLEELAYLLSNGRLEAQRRRYYGSRWIQVCWAAYTLPQD